MFEERIDDSDAPDLSAQQRRRGAIRLALAVILQGASWYLRARAQSRCCAPDSATDPYADVRSTSFPTLLAFAWLTLSFVLNGAFLLQFWRLLRFASNRFLEFFSTSVIVANLVWIAPLVLFSFFRSVGLPKLIDLSLVIAPTIAGAIWVAAKWRR